MSSVDFKTENLRGFSVSGQHPPNKMVGNFHFSSGHTKDRVQLCTIFRHAHNSAKMSVLCNLVSQPSGRNVIRRASSGLGAEGGVVRVCPGFGTSEPPPSLLAYVVKLV